MMVHKMYVGTFLVGMDAVYLVIKLEIKLIEMIVFLTELELSFAQSFLVAVSGKMMSPICNNSCLRCRLSHVHNLAGCICSLCYTVSTFNGY
ncbi:hypothetical protein C5167_044374 [Papaver somniferum]|uniref:Uncharacterized protein n=1 Tax=Papaver somniferum TaxID=3469 RepID=A0A4Y7LBZ8_PAPSO|nr:hypothetical protein C5167_044374 [Papaver somniferum]